MTSAGVLALFFYHMGAGEPLYINVMGHSIDLLRLASVSIVSSDLLFAALDFRWPGMKFLLFGFTFVPRSRVELHMLLT